MSRKFIFAWLKFIHIHVWAISSVHFNSVAQLCRTLCDAMDCSMPRLPVHHQLPEIAPTHVHQVGDAVQTFHPVIPFSSCLQSFPTSGSFPMSQYFASGCQSIGASASASVLPLNIQDWPPLGLTGLISLQSKGLSRVFSKTTVQKLKSTVQSQKTKIMASGPITSWQIDGETVTGFILGGWAPKSPQMVTAAIMKLKDACSLEEKLWLT